MNGAPRNDADGEVYFEHRMIGALRRVVAIDARSGLEVTVFGPARGSAADLERLALSKLRGRLSREQGQR